MPSQEVIRRGGKKKTRRNRQEDGSHRNLRSRLKKHIVFVDDSKANWSQDMNRFSDSIDFICVPSENREDSPQESEYTNIMLENGNRYAAGIVAALGSEMRNYPPNKGIDAEIADKLKAWASRASKNDKYILVDWDRTISYVEGIVPQAVNATDSEFLDDMFVYLLRRDRIPILKDLFRYLKSAGVHIHILTHNPAASLDSPYRAVFLEMMSRLFNDNSNRTEERDYVENGVHVHVLRSSSNAFSMIRREELNSMLHSTKDYVLPGQPLKKSNMVCHIIPGIRHCPAPRKTKRRGVFLVYR